MTDKTAREAGDTYYLMKDRLGSIIDILDENETLKTTYSYDAFGDPTITHHSGQVDCMYRFTGRVYDGAMGNYFYRARYYNQSLGRFFCRDPIFSLQSLYAYCNNSPANFTDPTGLSDESLTGRPEYEPLVDPIEAFFGPIEVERMRAVVGKVSDWGKFYVWVIKCLAEKCAQHTDFGKKLSCCLRCCTSCAWDNLSPEDYGWAVRLWCPGACMLWALNGDLPPPPDPAIAFRRPDLEFPEG